MDSISVVICSYTERRWEDLRRACASVERQLHGGDELVLVIDHNDTLLERARGEFPRARVVPNGGKPGLSGARNTGVESSRGDVVAFLDDDAVARTGWADALRETFAGAHVAVAGTAVVADWEGGHPPRWFPAEFGWVVGCSYRGQPRHRALVRNPIGASMAVRRKVFDEIGGFSGAIGRVGATPVGCEETEFCIRVTEHDAADVVVLDPATAVDHHVPADRQTMRYFVRRCYHEGRSKRIVALLRGADAGLSAERTYVRVTLPSAVLRGVAGAARDPGGLLRAGVVVLGLGSTVLGYAVESLRRGALTSG
ncbi:glycosyltransferase family 2 protein [Paractinoplanes globisporus]|uniref:Glycosyltransferase family 2 protein n=1 Tax=Paractinoplanes globisporus TaxID=113565 RepID=A0ABW6WI50_9ACTN|nr:glycosyltransferase family 2 protein [Actinoplanes globisporus]